MQQFERFLNNGDVDMADDYDTQRAERLGTLLERSTKFTRQKDLADALGVEVRTLQRWLVGGNIAKRYWAPLAAELGTTVRFLVFGEEPEPVEASIDFAAELSRQRELQEALLAEMQELRRLLQQGPPPASSPDEDPSNGPPEALLARSPRRTRTAPPYPE